jgi:hypothetical protein
MFITRFKQLAIIVFLMMPFFGFSQKDKALEEEELARYPHWIKMMEDPNVNYFKALEAFEAYWEKRVEPEEESELITEGKLTREQADSMQKSRSTWTQAQLNDYMVMKYQFKRFKDWKRSMFPYVQADGRILSEEERMQLYNQQLKERTGGK